MTHEIPGFTLHNWVQHWNQSLMPGHVQQFRSVGENTFILKIRTQTGNKQLLIALPSTITESTHQWKKLDEQSPIVNATKKIIENLYLTNVQQEGLDRIIYLQGDNANIVIELFGGGNVLVTDKQNKILFVHHAREWKGRTLKMNAEYKPPVGPRPWNELPEKISEAVERDSFQTVGGWMVSRLGVPVTLVEEACTIVKRNQRDDKALTQKDWSALRKYLSTLYEAKHMQYEIVNHAKGTSIVPANNKSEQPMTLEQTFACVEEELIQSQGKPKVNTKTESERQALLVNLERQQGQIKAWEKEAEEKQRAGEWVYEHFAEINSLLDAVQRGIKQKITDAKMNVEISKKLPFVKKIDTKKRTIELDA